MMYGQLLSKRVRFTRAIKRLNPLVYYPLNEVGNSIAHNYAISSIGDINGDVVGATLAQPGLVGRAYSFDGINDLITIPANTIPSFSGKSTIGFIVKVLETTASDKPVIDSQWGDNGGGGWQLIINNGNLTHCYVADATDRDDIAPEGGTFDLTDDFHFVVVTKNTTTGNQKLYIDGVLNNTNSSLFFGTTQPDTNRKLQLATNHPEDVFLNCLLQHVFIIGDELTLSKISELSKIIGKS